MYKHLFTAFVLAIVVAMTAVDAQDRASGAPEIGPALRSQVRELRAALPLSFEANRGQTDPRVQFVARAPGYDLFLTAGGAILSPANAISPVTMTLVGARHAPSAYGVGELTGRSNYFIGGDPRQWRTEVPHFRRVRYDDVYPGVDLIYYGNNRELEYDFHVAPGADPRTIRLAFGGVRGVHLDATGELVLDTPDGELRQRTPVLYQEIDGVRRTVFGRYAMRGRSEVGFEVDAYDRSKHLVIDPVLMYSSYVGGAGDDVATDIAIDAAGMIYVTGWTSSANFPIRNTITPPPVPDFFNPRFGSRGEDVFVTKIDPTESGDASLVYSTYIGGFGNDEARAIAVDAAGNAYIAGWTVSYQHPTLPPEAVFPVTAGAFQSTLRLPDFGVPSDGFIAKLSPLGNALLYSTYFGGGSIDIIDDLAVDAGGRVFVTGQTDSLRAGELGMSPLPTSPGAYQTAESPLIVNGTAAFVARFDPSQSGAASLLYSTYLGGTGGDYGRGIAVNARGEALIAGTTTSFDFPVVDGFQAVNRGGNSGFVSRISADGTALLYSTYLGGQMPCPFSGCSTGDLTDIALDTSGRAYVTGLATPGLPSAPNAYLPSPVGGGFAPFVMKLDTDAAGAASVVYVTYVNAGGFFDGADAIAVDAGGNAYVAGTTSGPFPTTPDAVSQTHSGTGDAFVAKIDPSATTLLYATYLGGGNNDVARGLAIDRTGNIFVAGETRSSDFPLVNPFQSTFGGWTRDAFVSVIERPGDPPSPDTTAPTISALLSDPANGAGWHRAAVTLSLAAADAESGVRSITYSSAGATATPLTTVAGGSVSVLLSADGSTTVSYVAVDNAGNESAPQTLAVKIDSAPPSIACGTADGLWHAANVSIACTAADATSGLAAAAGATFTLVTSVPAGVETASAASDSRTICDVAGNCATGGPVSGNKVDRQAPSISIFAPEAGATYALEQRVNALYRCFDSFGSGVQDCAGPVAAGGLVDTLIAGARQFTVNAADAVGNRATATVLYNVRYGVRTFYDTDRAHKSGSTIPIRIQLVDGLGNNLSSPSLVVNEMGFYRVSDQVSGELANPNDAPGSMDFKYDPSVPGYHFNLKTPTLASGRYLLLFRVGDDPVFYSTPFQIR
ncbi:MAG TPA: SBBP repeat-containing protein [Vicinamibacterales bacterium]|nr:SBBP repeat-containing protein [Vicinamibacterales bacterium]